MAEAYFRNYPIRTFLRDGTELPIYSQLGQAEWIYSLLASCGITIGSVFEAGAHSPNLNSNSRIFIENGWEAYLIESDQSHAHSWSEYLSTISLGKRDKVSIINREIPYESNGLESLFLSLSIKSLDVLFFDIDGGEYQLLESLNATQPNIVCVEADNGYPLNISYVPNHIRHLDQCSHRAMYEMMIRKGYIYLTGLAQDLIFVTPDLLHETILKYRPDLPYGEDFFFQTAHRNFENYFRIWDNWPQNIAAGVVTVEYFSTRLRRLVNNNQHSEASIFHQECLRVLDCLFLFMRISDRHFPLVDIAAEEILAFKDEFKHLSRHMV